MSKGRPKIIRPIEELSFTSFQEDITLFKNSLIDYIEDEDNESQINKDTIQKFLDLELWQQNIFIVYLLNKDKRVHNGFTFKALAELLQVERGELMRVIKNIKTKLAV